MDLYMIMATVPINGSNVSTAAGPTDADVDLIVNDLVQAHLQVRGHLWNPIDRSQLTNRTNGHSHSNGTNHGPAGRQNADHPALIARRMDSATRKKVSDCLKSWSTVFLITYGARITEMCNRVYSFVSRQRQLTASQETTPASSSASAASSSSSSSSSSPHLPFTYSHFVEIANELFDEGISWTHILTLITFATELAWFTVGRGYPNFVDDISLYLSYYISTRLTDWIRENGGWDGLIEFVTQDQPQEEQVDNRHWNLRFAALGALGCITLGILASRY